MGRQSFRELIVWQSASDSAVGIYDAFRDVRDFAFRDQIQRAAVSVMNNIAEGSARESDKSFRQFLIIARGSNTEVESMLHLAERLNYISKEQKLSLLESNANTGRLLGGLLKKLSAISHQP